MRGRFKKSNSGKRADGSLRRDTVQAAATTLKLAVGDDVVLEPGARGEAWAIAEILPRRSRLARRMPGGGQGERVVAANVDQVVVMFAAAKPEPHPRMLDRFLVIAEGNDLAARVVINKVELVGEASTRERFKAYERAGYPVFHTSVKAAIGLEPLRAALAGRRSVFTGPSGVGKSSLLNALFPGANLRVGAISESVNKGRHTTVGAVMLPLPGPRRRLRDRHAGAARGRHVGAAGGAARLVLPRDASVSRRLPLCRLSSRRRAGLRRSRGGSHR